MHKKTIVIILAGGSGERFDVNVAKQFIKLAGKPIIEHTIEAFERHSLIDEIYLVVNPYYMDIAQAIGSHYCKIRKIIQGGATRQESSRIGVLACDENVDKILIHDAVRPFVSERIITDVIRFLDEYPSVDVAIPTADTIINVSDQKIISDIPQRKYLFRGQTPQGFWRPIITKAHSLAEKEGFKDAVDDCSLILKYQLGNTYVVDGSEYNIKITHPLDLDIADKIFQINGLDMPNIDISDISNIMSGKVVVIFGGTSGIGLEIVRLCQELGIISYGFSRSTGADIRNPQAIRTALENVCKLHNRIDVVICSAGIMVKGQLERMEIDDIVDQINTNLIGSMLVAKESITYLKMTSGSMLFFASSSYTRGRGDYIPYSASKAGLVNFVQGLAEEMSSYSIKVNVINPERTNTPLRRAHFLDEDKTTLLSPRFVALATLRTIASGITGAVIDVRKVQEDG